jgi:hypothetical protein
MYAIPTTISHLHGVAWAEILVHRPSQTTPPLFLPLNVITEPGVAGQFSHDCRLSSPSRTQKCNAGGLGSLCVVLLGVVADLAWYPASWLLPRPIIARSSRHGYGHRAFCWGGRPSGPMVAGVATRPVELRSLLYLDLVILGPSPSTMRFPLRWWFKPAPCLLIHSALLVCWANSIRRGW